MTLRERVKSLVEFLPEPVARPLSRIPYSVKLGRIYRETQDLVRWAADAPYSDIAAWQAKRLRVVLSAANRIRGYPGDQLPGNMVCGLVELPHRVSVLTKDQLREVPLRLRSNPGYGARLTNTGGTSGSPLDFYLGRHAFAREWAHMHSLWAGVGYCSRDLKLTLRGKNLGESPVRYNGVHNEIVVNACSSWDKVVSALKRRGDARLIRYIHGYPSLVAEFADYLLGTERPLLRTLRRSVRAALLGSEYPAPPYRDSIESAMAIPTYSWYGHSEMALLAGEIERGVYAPLPTYGLAEAIPSGTSHALVATSLWNTASPFIRYDTGDRVEPVDLYPDGFLRAFRISEARVGDFIVDRAGHRISLTAFIFGRHHPAFSVAQTVQVQQQEEGLATLYVTLPGDRHDRNRERLADGFDLTGVDIHFTITIVPSPYRTAAGKTPLKIPSHVTDSWYPE